MEINIEEIMQEIRNNIKARGYDKEPLSFEDVDVSEYNSMSSDGYSPDVLSRELIRLNQNCNNPISFSVSGGKVAVFVKKVFRKLTRFIIYPILSFQNSYNASNLRCLNQIKACLDELETYKQRVEALEEEVKNLKKQ